MNHLKLPTQQISQFNDSVPDTAIYITNCIDLKKNDTSATELARDLSQSVGERKSLLWMD